MEEIDSRINVYITKQDNSWHERGELPPVGAVCEAHITSENLWVEIEVVAHRDGYVLGWCRNEKCGYHGSEKSDFRPLRTEREKAIDALIDIICAGGYFTRRDGAAREIAERIHDAGMLKQ